ncbi:MAG: PIN domain-containing protein [Promethearchaeota archaeon]|nr:MAG: PIN domain-containing protein [Candidatus Lokiarchaeota archaeon]
MTTYFLDTNILWWYFVKNSKNHQQIKLYLDELILDAQNSFIINEFVLIELFHLLIKQKGNEGYKLVSLLINESYPFVEFKYDLLHISDLNSVLQILFKYGTTTSIGGRDSTIIYSMNRHKVKDIITNDRGYENVEFITVHNPLK